MKKSIISEEKVTIRGDGYIQITYDNGEKILKRYDEEFNMWLICEFTQKDDSNRIKKLKQTVINALIK